MQLGISKDNKEDKIVKTRESGKCTMTDIFFITLINYIRENGIGGIIAISEYDTSDKEGDRLNIIDTKSQLLTESGFISKDINRSIYSNSNKSVIKKFMAQNEYNYTNNLFQKTLKFIKDNDYGICSSTLKLYNSKTRKSMIISDFYDYSLIETIKRLTFEYLNLKPNDWSRYIQLINNKNTKDDILEHTKQLFKTLFKDKENNDYKLNFYNKHGIDWDIIYPAYMISIFDYEQNNIDIDNYIADKVKRLNFDKTDYVEMRSKKGTYKKTYDRLIDLTIEELENEVDKELFDLIQNDNYFDTIQLQLFKWYKFSIFDTHKKTNYISSREQKKITNKIQKEQRNETIQLLKEEGWTQKQVSEDLHIGIATVKRQWNS